MAASSSAACLNCGAPLAGAYCSRCGQKAARPDLTLAGFLHAAGLIGLWPFGSPRPTPFESTAANETERRLEAALAGLPVRYREALLLVAVEGLRPAEAADVCGVSSETMRQRLSRARAALASRMDPTVTPAVGWSKLARHEVT